VLEQWAYIETDLHALFGIDLDAPLDRTWRWLRSRILAVVSTPETRTHSALRRAKEVGRDA